jgi:hypothetical protein
MKKEMVIILGVLLMFTSSCLQQESVECGTADDVDACYLDKAIADGNLNECDNIESSQSQDACYAAMAEVENDTEICRSISDNSISNLCFINLAVKNSDSSICDEILDELEKENCLSLF